MTRIVDWRIHARCKDWVNLEWLISVIKLHSIPWFSKKPTSPNLHTHPLIGASLHEFDRACKVRAISASKCLITPTRGNSDSPPGLTGNYLSQEWSYAEMQEKYFFHRGTFVRQQELAPLSNTKSFPLWSYIQLKHFLDDSRRKEGYTKAPNSIQIPVLEWSQHCMPPCLGNHTLYCAWTVHPVGQSLRTLAGTAYIYLSTKVLWMWTHRKMCIRSKPDGIRPKIGFTECFHQFQTNAGDMKGKEGLFSTYGGLAHWSNHIGITYMRWRRPPPRSPWSSL